MNCSLGNRESIVLERTISNLKKERYITPTNKSRIIDFINANSHVKPATQINYITHLRDLARYIRNKAFDNLNRSEVNKYLPELANKYAPRSYNNRIKTIKLFARWINKLDIFVDYKKRNGIQPVHQASDLITLDELKRLLDACITIRDRCLLHLLWETGCRIGELQGVRLKDIKEEEFGYTIVIRDSKTKARECMIIEAKDDLDAWLQQHPYKTNKDSYLLCALKSRNRIVPMAYTTVRSLLESLMEKTQINKRMHAHLFRKSRASYLSVVRRWPNPLIEKAMGWAPSSKILSEYVRISQQDVKNQALMDAGVIQNNVAENISWKCLFCSHVNSATRDRCYACKKSHKTAEEIVSKQVELEDVMKQIQMLQREIAVIKRK